MDEKLLEIVTQFDCYVKIHIVVEGALFVIQIRV